MKIKINSFYIICAILAEIIIVNLLLIVVFIKVNHVQTASNKNIKVITLKKSDIVKTRKNQAQNKVQDRVHSKVQNKPKKQTVKDNKNKNSRKDFIAKKSNGLYQDEVISSVLDMLNNDFVKIKFKMKDCLTIEKKGFIATAYDLSFQSCGKYPDNPSYGITYSGSKAIKGRTIAVDPDVIPLGSKVYIEFPKEYISMNGWYIAEDTGSKVKGNTIDVFMGKSALTEAMDFGRRKVNLQIQITKN